MTTSMKIGQAIDWTEIKAKELFERGYPLSQCIKYASLLAATTFNVDANGIELATWARAREQVQLRKEKRSQLENNQ